MYFDYVGRQLKNNEGLRKKTKTERLERIRIGLEKNESIEEIAQDLKRMGCWGYGRRLIKQTIQFLKYKKNHD